MPIWHAFTQFVKKTSVPGEPGRPSEVQLSTVMCEWTLSDVLIAMINP